MACCLLLAADKHLKSDHVGIHSQGRPSDPVLGVPGPHPTWSLAAWEASVPPYLDPRFLLVHNNCVEGITVHTCVCARVSIDTFS